jgi:hypothetical protein
VSDGAAVGEVGCSWLAGWRPALAQDDGQFKPRADVRAGGSLQQAGEVQDRGDVDDHAAPISEPEPRERARKKEAGERAAPPPPAGGPRVPAEVLALDTNMPARVRPSCWPAAWRSPPTAGCAGEGAAGTVLLRWTVQPGGGVTDAETVAQREGPIPRCSPASAHKMETGVHPRPGGEPLPVEQTLSSMRSVWTAATAGW